MGVIVSVRKTVGVGTVFLFLLAGILQKCRENLKRGALGKVNLQGQADHFAAKTFTPCRIVEDLQVERSRLANVGNGFLEGVTLAMATRKIRAKGKEAIVIGEEMGTTTISCIFPRAQPKEE